MQAYLVGQHQGDSSQASIASSEAVKQGSELLIQHLGIIFLELKDLRGHVQGGATEGVCHSLWLQVSGKAEVCNLQHSLAGGIGEQEVLRLQITLQDEEKE